MYTNFRINKHSIVQKQLSNLLTIYSEVSFTFHSLAVVVRPPFNWQFLLIHLEIYFQFICESMEDPLQCLSLSKISKKT